ncbi:MULTISPECIES: hypothetical protein [Enterobacteriaceae]|uniref:hypothetical protein n=1 Tax=Enterobacteriaceae TaxID=543 RepID=UPI0010DAAEC8|nr:MULTISPECIES: hypothetical protein [Enterobacteriaceae]MDA4736867.1 hypothetical protein [Enterobacter kobei]MDA4743137.1 hypothetical protein [Enterobacter hormaechei]GDB25355.1 hypothetical protein HmCmsJML259_00338 [Escherichia coli]
MKTYYIHPAAFGSTQDPGHGHVPVVKAEDFEKLRAKLEAAEKQITELVAREETLRPVGVMSEKAFLRLERSESRFIALWPRPGIYLPRKRPEDGVIVYARTAGPA